MAYGDVGGSVTELVITCKTPAAGPVSITKGDAVKLTGAYTVDNAAESQDGVFGQALADVDTEDTALPVRVRGVCVFAYAGAAPVADGEHGVLASAEAGKVEAPVSGTGVGRNLKVDAAAMQVHVLL